MLINKSIVVLTISTARKWQVSFAFKLSTVLQTDLSKLINQPFIKRIVPQNGLFIEHADHKIKTNPWKVYVDDSYELSW